MWLARFCLAGTTLGASLVSEHLFYARSMGVGPRHVWVKQDTSAHAPDPGLLMMWRQRRGRWEGWVVWASYVAAHDRLTVRQGWVDAAHLREVGLDRA